MSRTHHQRRARIARALARTERRPVVAPSAVDLKLDANGDVAATSLPIRALDPLDDEDLDMLGEGQPLRATFIEAISFAFRPQRERGSADRGLVFLIGAFAFVFALTALPWEAALVLVVCLQVVGLRALLRGKQ